MRFHRVERVEIAALGFAAAGLAWLAAHGLAPTRGSVDATLFAMAGVLPFSFVAGVLIRAAYEWATRDGVQAWGYLQSVASPAWLLLFLRLWLATMLTSFTYFQVKLVIPLVNDASFDEALWQLDRWLHFGVAPSVLALEWLRSGTLASAVDVWYGAWLLTVVLGISFFAAASDARLRRGVVLSCVLLWATGAIVYTGLPVVGPVFAFPSMWNEARGTMPYTEVVQRALWANYELVRDGGGAALAEADHTRGVAAVPSLHVAFHALFALWARVEARPIFWPLVAATALTLVGSVMTGWHYAVDGYVGIALAWGCFRLARAWEAG